MNWILIGPRGVGKSKVSRALAKMTGMTLLSTDMIASYELGGTSIASFVAKNGGDWKEFRDLEKQILTKLKSADNSVLDCGGGILFGIDREGNEIFDSEKADLLRSMGEVVLLEKDLEELVRKVQGDATRPSLSQIDSYRSILQRRLPYYRKACHHQMKVDGLSKEEVVQAILQLPMPRKP